MSGGLAQRAFRATAEGLAAVVTATATVAALKSIAPVSGLGVVYLLAVVLAAIRNGIEVAPSQSRAQLSAGSHAKPNELVRWG